MNNHTRQYCILRNILITSSLWIISFTCFAEPTVELYPTFHAMGITVQLDDDSDADRITVAYKEGNDAFREGFPLSRVHNVNLPRFSGSLFNLSPDTNYDVQVTLHGGNYDGTTLRSISSKTRSELDISRIDGAPTLIASANGVGTQCSVKSPCLLETAISMAGAGHEIELKPGIYKTGHIALDDETGPYKGAPLVIRSQSLGSVIFDGSIAPFDEWQQHEVGEGVGVYKTPYNNEQLQMDEENTLSIESLVMHNEVRLYPYQDIDSLKSLIYGVAGFYVDPDSRYLYVHLSNHSMPGAGSISISNKRYAFRVKQNYTFFENIVFQFYGMTNRAKAIFLDTDTVHSVIRNCSFRVNDIGVGIGNGSSDNVIEHSYFSDTVEDWSWDAVKAGPSELESGGVFFESYDTSRLARGNVIRSNEFTGFFDSVSITPGRTATDYVVETKTNETDYYFNKTNGAGDDCVSSDSYASNVRIWGNQCQNTLTGISFAPAYGGPVYAIRNLIYNLKVRPTTQQDNGIHKGAPFKLLRHGENSGEMFFFHNTADARNTCPNNEGRCSNGFAVDGSKFKWRLICGRNNIWLGSDRALAGSGVVNTVNCILNNAYDMNSVSLDYDNIYNTGLNQLVVWDGIEHETIDDFRSATSQELGGISVSPGFANASIGNYQLNRQSSMIDMGYLIPGINDNYSGFAPDIGYFELTDDGDNDPYCSGDVVYIQNNVFNNSSTTLCKGNISITTGQSVSVQSGANVIFQSPRIYLRPGFKVYRNGNFRSQ